MVGQPQPFPTESEAERDREGQCKYAIYYWYGPTEWTRTEGGEEEGFGGIDNIDYVANHAHYLSESLNHDKRSRHPSLHPLIHRSPHSVQVIL